MGLLSTVMAYDKNVSPVGWYYGSYLLRFVEMDDAQRNDPERRFLSWENTVIVEAKSLGSAYSKVEKLGKAECKPYRGGPKGVRVRWEYLGVTELLPIYEELADGAEIAWVKRKPRKLRALKSLVRSKQEFVQYAGTIGLAMHSSGPRSKKSLGNDRGQATIPCALKRDKFSRARTQPTPAAGSRAPAGAGSPAR